MLVGVNEHAVVRVKAHGPYEVSGGLQVYRREAVESEHGEPLAWETTEELPSAALYALCRCGGSSRKPFCDRTHARTGFDGTEAAPTDTYAERAKAYPGTGVVVDDDRGLCEHAGFCGNRVSNVWKMVAETGDSITRGQVMSMIEKCPSGALTYRLAPGAAPVEPLLPAAIGVVKDGPLWLTGEVRVERADGEPFERRNRVTLCRCGQSASKPLCDGSHKAAGFRDG
jgi:CDGSH-type Zn-finger protein